MNKVTILLGKGPCGKTARAMELSKNKKSLVVSQRGLKQSLFLLESKRIEILVVEEASDKAALMEFITMDKILINERGKNPVEIKRPEVIITSNIFNKSDFRPRSWLTVIDCSETNA